MLQLRDLPTPEILNKFSMRYPDADVGAISTFLFLLRVATDLSNVLDDCLNRHGLLQGRWWVLILLMREDSRSLTPSQLSDKIGVSRASITGLLDGLERDGLITRFYNEKDRRSLSIGLTESGQKKLDQVMPDYYECLKFCMSDLDPGSKNQLNQMLSLISHKLQTFF